MASVSQAPKHLRPFWRYYGGKWRSSGRYPDPVFGTVVEPFAGAAGYACRHWRRDVVLVDRSPIIAGIWRYLIAESAESILALPDIPDGGTVDDMDAPQEARWLAGFWCNGGKVTPSKSPSAWARASASGDVNNWAGWGDKARRRVARQVQYIRHWRVVEGEYTDAPDAVATWFIDPPYSTPAGEYYPEQPGDRSDCAFADLATWCRTRSGQVVVCEQAGATWLPFAPLGDLKSRRGTSSEVVWLAGPQSAQGSLW